MHLKRAFAEGLIYRTEQGQCQLKRRRLGELTVVSGAIVACDPLTDIERSGFQRRLSPGKYPVIATIAHFADRDDERVAFATLQIKPQVPDRWEAAACKPPRVGEPAYPDASAYGVFSGVGGFLDEHAGDMLMVKAQSQTDTGEFGFGYLETIRRNLETNQVDMWSWANHVLDPETGLNMVLFSSGWGNGQYKSFWGLDARGTALCLMTDFQVVG